VCLHDVTYVAATRCNTATLPANRVVSKVGLNSYGQYGSIYVYSTCRFHTSIVVRHTVTGTIVSMVTIKPITVLIKHIVITPRSKKNARISP